MSVVKVQFRESGVVKVVPPKHDIAGGFPRLSASINRLIQEQRFADILDFGDGAFQVECFGQDNLKNLLHVDAVAGAAEDEAGAHSFGEPSSLDYHVLALSIEQVGVDIPDCLFLLGLLGGS